MNACIECAEKRKIYVHGVCRRCYTKRINNRSLRTIASEFRAASTYNRELFDAFVTDFSGRHVKNADLPVAKRLAAHLGAHPVGQIRTWMDVYELSKNVAIRYTNHPIHGCPFMRIGRQLAKQGKLPKARDARVAQYLRLMAKFSDDMRPVMTEFYKTIAGGHKRTSSSLKVLCSIVMFGQSIKKPILRADKGDAKEFIASLSQYGAAHYTERVRSLNRFFRWAKANGLTDGNPFEAIEHTHIARTCPNCGRGKIFWTADDRCDECYRDKLFRDKCGALTKSVTFPWEYNRYFFALYLKYIDRYRITGRHLRSTKLMIEFLKGRELKALKSWADVARARRSFMGFHDLKRVPEKGCPIEKAAYVLQELGVLPIREEDHGIYVENAINRAAPDFAVLIREYLKELRRQRRSVRTLHGTFKMVHDFYLWLKSKECESLFSASEELARGYILSRSTQDHTGVLRRVLDKFYRWAVFRKKAVFNPLARIEAVKPSPTLEICSNETIKALERFMKRSTSDPEGALILCLIFFYGFTATDLAMANLDVYQDRLTITLHRRDLSYGHNMHKREQVLKLPVEPQWLQALQKRYLALWKARYEKIKKDFPSSPLLLRSDSRHPRPLRTLAVCDRVRAATNAAAGFEIPISVIRRTGAHVYSRQVGSAILTEFGWSQDYSFDFVWRQRKLFTPRQK